LLHRHSITEEGCELLVSIVEARDLVIPQDADPDSIDTFVRVYLVPDEADAMQTKIFRNSSNPSYQESFLFFITKQNIKRSLWFHLYHTNAHCTTLIGKKLYELMQNCFFLCVTFFHCIIEDIFHNFIFKR